jgi:2Fe-2S iron-sulfur cluster binding domain
MTEIQLEVNGKTETVTTDDPDIPLLYILRDDLGLHGPRFGCGLGQCGACTAHVDGQATRSCITPLSQIGTHKIVTLEDLGTAAHPHGRDRDRARHGDQPRLVELSDPDLPGGAGGRDRPDRPPDRGALGRRRTLDSNRAGGNQQRRLRRHRRAAALGAVYPGPGEAAIRDGLRMR